MQYHDHDQLMNDLEMLQKATPSDVTLFSLGKSIGGRELRGVRLKKGDSSNFSFVLSFVLALLSRIEFTSVIFHLSEI